MTDRTLTQQIDDINKQLKPLIRQQKSVNRAISALVDVRTALEEKRDEEEIANGDADWTWLLYENGGCGKARYDEATKRLAEISLSHKGYLRDIQQRGVSFALYRDDAEHNAKVLAGLKTVLPFVKALNGVKYLDITERTLSSGGVFYVHVHDDRVALMKTTYGYNEELKSFPTLDEAIDYLAKHHWYQKTKTDWGRDDDDDDDD